MQQWCIRHWFRCPNAAMSEAWYSNVYLFIYYVWVRVCVVYVHFNWSKWKDALQVCCTDRAWYCCPRTIVLPRSGRNAHAHTHSHTGCAHMAHGTFLYGGETMYRISPQPTDDNVFTRPTTRNTICKVPAFINIHYTYKCRVWLWADGHSPVDICTHLFLCCVLGVRWQWRRYSIRCCVQME